MIRTLLLVGAGSFIGGTARFLLSRIAFNGSFPAGTLLVNVAGCLLIGTVYGLSERFCFLDDDIRFFLTAGICGGFTTFSTFAYDTVRLADAGQYWLSAGYVLASVATGLVAVRAGIFLTRLF